MHKLLLFLIVAAFSFLVFLNDAEAKLTEQDAKFIQTITKDFINTHSIKLNGYHFYDMREISPTQKRELTTQEKSLINILEDIASGQNYIDCSPIFYINTSNNKGYILEKKLSGLNTLHVLSYDKESQTWKTINTFNKMGKDLIDLGLLKGSY